MLLFGSYFAGTSKSLKDLPEANLPSRSDFQTDLSVGVLAACASPCAWAQGEAPLTLADALKMVLRNNPQVQIQEEQINVQKGILRQTAGQFDLALAANGFEARTHQPLTGYNSFLYSEYDGYFRNSVAANSSQLNLSAVKELRNGIQFSSDIQALRIADNLTNRVGYNQGGIHFNALVPLLAGKGKRVVAANETAASKQVQAAVLNTDETAAITFAQVTSSYWNVVAARQEVTLMQDSNDRANNLLTAANSLILTAANSLIEADRMPRSDLAQIQADLALRQAARVDAEQRLVDARAQLALQMGVEVNGELDQRAVDGNLPDVLSPEQVPSDPAAVGRYTRYALRERPDLQALKSR